MIQTSVEPSIRINGCSCGFGIVQISKHQLRTACTYLSLVASCTLLSILRVDQLSTEVTASQNSNKRIITSAYTRVTGNIEWVIHRKRQTLNCVRVAQTATLPSIIALNIKYYHFYLIYETNSDTLPRETASKSRK